MNDDTGRRELVVSFCAGAFVLRYMREKNDTLVIIRGLAQQRKSRPLLLKVCCGWFYEPVNTVAVTCLFTLFRRGLLL